jgi:hypothetical protein
MTWLTLQHIWNGSITNTIGLNILSQGNSWSGMVNGNEFGQGYS